MRLPNSHSRRRFATWVLLPALLVGGCSLTSADLEAVEPAPPPFPASALNFLVLGDWGRNGRYNQTAVAESMADFAADNAVQFVVTTGDNFYENGVESTADPQWKHSFESIYSAPSLQIPWYPTLGNHDYRGMVQAQIDYSRGSSRWTMPARYYAVALPVGDTLSALFVFLDTVELLSDDEPAAERQLLWLDSTLAASKSAWEIVVGHHPLYAASAKHADPVKLQEELRPLFDKYEVEAYVAGHVHSLQHIAPPGETTAYFISGGGSKTRPVDWKANPLFAARVSGFMAASISGDRMEVRFVDQRGTTGYVVQVGLREKE